MYTIRRTATIVAVAAGLAAGSAGLAYAAEGGPTSAATAAATADASPAAANAVSSAAGAVSVANGSTSVHVETQADTSASAQIDNSAPNVPAENVTTTGGAWCATYRLAVAVGGDSWFGSVHVKGLCEQPQP